MGGAASAPEDPGAAVPSADGAATEVASQTGRTDRVPPADAKAVAAGAADRRSFDAGDAYVTGATPYTERDEAWLRSGPLSKALDPNLRVVRVASRCPRNGTPRVLECYPLRRTLRVARSETKGFSKHKWNPRVGDRPVPWPNTFWLCCPVLIASVGALEHCGLIKKHNTRFRRPDAEPDPARARADAKRFAAQHARYASHRWRMLSPADRTYARREGYDAILEKCGVGGLRHPEQVKCLHLHYAHFLATGDNLVGEWCQNALDAKEKQARDVTSKRSAPDDERTERSGSS